MTGTKLILVPVQKQPVLIERGRIALFLVVRHSYVWRFDAAADALFSKGLERYIKGARLDSKKYTSAMQIKIQYS